MKVDYVRRDREPRVPQRAEISTERYDAVLAEGVIEQTLIRVRVVWRGYDGYAELRLIRVLLL
jgi:hypothetical protein